LKRRDIIRAYERGRDAVIDLVQGLVCRTEQLEGDNDALRNENAELAEKTALLEERVKDLEKRINKNSRNSSKPPSSDGFKRKTPVRKKKSGRSPGGQKGHPGHTLEMVENPDETVLHPVEECSHCGRSLAAVDAEEYEKRQVSDLPPVRIVVTEHRSEVKRCPSCGHTTRARFPEEVKKPTSYGPNLRSLVAYLVIYQHVPYKRASELVYELTGRGLSTGTCVNICRELNPLLATAEGAARLSLLSSPALGVDETGIRIAGRNFWLHVACTAMSTLYLVHEKRGSEATDAMGILPDYDGRAIHDSWNPYFGYDCDHGLCCAHLLRELAGIGEDDPERQAWAGELSTLLVDTKKLVDERKEKGRTSLRKRELEFLESEYDRITAMGWSANPIVENDGPKKRGRPKKTDAQNLLARLCKHKEWVLAFAYDFTANFDNNQSERDLRMAKLQQKISGCFRSMEGAEGFFRARGYISTARKNDLSAMEALRLAYGSDPFLPPALFSP